MPTHSGESLSTPVDTTSHQDLHQHAQADSNNTIEAKSPIRCRIVSQVKKITTRALSFTTTISKRRRTSSPSPAPQVLNADKPNGAQEQSEKNHATRCTLAAADAAQARQKPSLHRHYSHVRDHAARRQLIAHHQTAARPGRAAPIVEARRRLCDCEHRPVYPAVWVPAQALWSRRDLAFDRQRAESRGPRRVYEYRDGRVVFDGLERDEARRREREDGEAAERMRRGVVARRGVREERVWWKRGDLVGRCC